MIRSQVKVDCYIARAHLDYVGIARHIRRVPQDVELDRVPQIIECLPCKVRYA